MESKNARLKPGLYKSEEAFLTALGMTGEKDGPSFLPSKLGASRVKRQSSEAGRD